MANKTRVTKMTQAPGFCSKDGSALVADTRGPNRFNRMTGVKLGAVRCQHDSVVLGHTSAQEQEDGSWQVNN